MTTSRFADPELAVAHFSARLGLYTDVSDVRAALASGEPGFTLVDTRARVAWDQGHVPGAVHLPRTEIAARAAALVDPDLPVVVYCWGPGCDGAAKGALEFARLGRRVKEMVGGIEYWIREGFEVETASGVERSPVDPLTAPVHSPVCAC
ncbi:rhodanese-like domain-containing protein [Nocardiopsis changdeensis]|uniref:Rhodanese-like domain-containing protein n=1 Tax=Nocardiopsis changdeensis TaxID=2831969 RepID=A0ABX8BKL9_9ACTN|nr:MULTISPECIES: rhodanese-like domain-containing protein [Nocardiopsis]QUX22770.1 rhodanese-like domain-containing protein [Nocardiopsis changdeensis]QYX38713.1 rhodanese-like domain-containing protein [Nocardiopsis sp. MT53]